MKKLNATEGDRHYNAVAEIRLRTNHFEQQEEQATLDDLRALIPEGDEGEARYVKFLLDYAAKLASALPTSPSRSRLSALSRS